AKVMRAEAPDHSLAREAAGSKQAAPVVQRSRSPLREHPDEMKSERSRSPLREHPEHSAEHLHRKSENVPPPVSRAEEDSVAGQREASAEASAGFAEQLEASEGGGESLSPNTRSFFESKFNADFSAVRVHTGPEADRLARDIHAKAFTRGNHIYF